MALIEGVGDEVTLLFGSLLLLMVLLLAWISTRTSDPPEHLFTSSTGPAPSLRTGPAHQETPPSSASGISLSSSSSPSSSSSSSVSDSALTEAPPTAQEVRGEGEGAEPLSSARNMVVRLKFLNDTERTAQVKPQDTIGYIKR
ncbi:transmembrane and ubiquitin-like domain-containing protein 1 [Stegastes partitus]|uniref:Transmembrane and ubiquitin-like domain-containing protein 1 n=1 Tax=Stegastes partitus TaxID=144197 RepID=A0A9Y4TS53_9TELE|nr:PREDICTED: transmembrane and ubiquitin-like domain-containing protein 1 [Stegastes partitus]XP_008299961.1 PREDICTED: transmembrane and ubiquitin-like domain-containing protein 1 [Stegastes partitus]XP_008299962.1 PREDICTED: transmembrane and ubiquitin-like domain-containing protein 1 [Stegastes partitus]